MENKIGKNRQSPKNEKDYINAYLKANPKANRQDGMDIAAVIAKDGTKKVMNYYQRILTEDMIKIITE